MVKKIVFGDKGGSLCSYTDTAPTENYTRSLHDSFPVWESIFFTTELYFGSKGGSL